MAVKLLYTSPDNESYPNAIWVLSSLYYERSTNTGSVTYRAYSTAGSYMTGGLPLSDGIVVLNANVNDFTNTFGSIEKASTSWNTPEQAFDTFFMSSYPSGVGVSGAKIVSATTTDVDNKFIITFSRPINTHNNLNTTANKVFVNSVQITGNTGDIIGVSPTYSYKVSLGSSTFSIGDTIQWRLDNTSTPLVDDLTGWYLADTPLITVTNLLGSYFNFNYNFNSGQLLTIGIL